MLTHQSSKEILMSVSTSMARQHSHEVQMIVVGADGVSRAHLQQGHDEVASKPLQGQLTEYA